MPQGKRLEHQGIKIEVIGQVRARARPVPPGPARSSRALRARPHRIASSRRADRALLRSRQFLRFHLYPPRARHAGRAVERDPVRFRGVLKGRAPVVVPGAPPRRYPFDFSNAEKPYESYNGLNVRLRYFIRVTVTRGYPTGNLVKEQDFVVQRAARAPGPRAFPSSFPWL